MKKLLLSVMLLCATTAGMAQSAKLTNSAQILLAKHADASANQRRAAGNGAVNEQPVLATIILNEGKEVTDSTLEALNIEVVKRRGTVLFAYVPIRSFEALAQIDGIKTIHAGGKGEAKNDKARKNTLVANVHEMDVAQSATAGVPEKYRGNGVLVGVVDMEIDFGHPAFRNADGTSRIKELGYKAGAEGQGKIVICKEDKIEEGIKKAHDSTKRIGGGHGTHVAGIAAGSTDLLADNDPNKTYYGMAPEANMLAYDIIPKIEEDNNLQSDVLLYLTSAFDKADELNQPIVVNMSLGENSAQLDGTYFMCEGMTEIMKNYDMKGKVVCIAAGNEGGANKSVQIDCEKAIVDDGWTAQKYMYFNIQEDGDEEGMFGTDMVVSLYGADDREFAVKYLVLDQEQNMLLTTDILTPALIEAQKGSIMLKGVSPTGNNYEIKLIPTFSITSANRRLHTAEFSGTFADPLMIAAVLYTKSEGMHVDGAVNRNIFIPVPDDPEVAVPNDYGSTNPWACTDNVISVGAYTNRDHFVNPKGEITDDHLGPTVIGEIAGFSSYNTSFYGTQRPEIIAPGRMLISSYHQMLTDDQIVGSTTYNGADYQWGDMSGTSMAAPVVSGIIALWLQADPTLTVADVREVLKQTCDYDEFCEAEPARAGMGKINALRGLEYILSKTDIKDVNADSDNRTAKRMDSKGRLLIEKDGRTYNVVGIRVK